MEAMDDNVERVAKRRRLYLTLLIFAFLALQASYFGASERLVASIPNGAARLVDVISVAGSLLWSLLLIRVIAPGARLPGRVSRAAREALDDELTQANRRAAFQAGYVAMVFGGSVLYAISLFQPADALVGLPILVGFGALVPAVRFLILESSKG